MEHTENEGWGTCNRSPKRYRGQAVDVPADLRRQSRTSNMLNDSNECEKAKVEITPQMVEAGFQVLCSSGIADEYPERDKLLIVEIFRAMASASPRSNANSYWDRDKS